MEKHINFLAVGDIAIDNFIELKDAHLNCNINHENCELCLKFGQKVPYENAIEVRATGNSANAAVSASRLGLKSALVSSVGDDQHGRDCIETLIEENVGVDFVNIDKFNPTNYHFVLRYGAERTILVKHVPFEYTLPKENIKVDWVYFSSISEHSLSFHKEISEWLSKRPDTKLAFQPGTFQIKMGTDLLKNIYKKTEIFFSNKEEAQAILKTPARPRQLTPESEGGLAPEEGAGGEEEDMKKLLKGIHKLGPQKVVITDGKNGLTASDGKSIYSLPMFHDTKEPVDLTGAGDATSSTITAMFSMGIPFEEALRYGPVNSMSVVREIGPQKGLLNKAKIEEYLKDAPDYLVK